MSPDENISDSGTKTSRPGDHKVMGTGNKHFAHGSLAVIMSGASPIFTPLIPGPVSLGYQ